MSGGHGGFLHEALFNGNGVAKKLIVALVLFSSVITALITGFELYALYRQGLGQINRSVAFISQSQLPALVDSVWVADNEQVQLQIDGFLRLPEIEYIGISVDGKTRWSAGMAVSQRSVTAEVPLVRQHRGLALEIGRLKVVASVDQVLARLWAQLIETLISNAVKTLMVAGFMLLVFQYLVTRHLTRLAAFVSRIDPAAPMGERLQFDRPAAGRWRPDILDAVMTSVNELSGALHGAHQNLRQSEQRLRVLTRETAALVYEVDRDGLILFANRGFPGHTREQVEGTALAPWFAPEAQVRIAQALARSVHDAWPQRFEYSMPDASGKDCAYVAALVPILRDGQVTSVALTALDISEQKAAELEIRGLNSSLEARVRERTEALEQATERAVRASRAKSEFLSRMSHELRTPMNAVLGFAQLIETAEPSPKQLRWAGEIRRAGDHLLRMIEDLLDLARIEVGKMAIRVEPLDMESVVDESIAITRPLIDSMGIALVKDCDGTPWRVMADSLRLRQVVLNLLSNAAKYNRKQGSITVRCQRKGERVRLTVADTGMGVAPEKLALLFQPFERLGAELGEVEGTGIGLALSKQLAELMGATIGADSRVGVGSEFWIEMRAAETASLTPAQTAAPPTAPLEANFKLLYVEDKGSNTEVVADFLMRHPGVQLRTASTGEEGLALAHAWRPDIVLLDLHLPGMDGYEVLRQLRADPQLARTPVVALSADAMPHDVKRGVAAGMDHYLAKPVVLDELLKTLVRLAPAR